MKNGDIPADKYRLYKPGSVVLTPGVRAYLSENAAFFQNVGMFFDSARPDDEWEIWFSMKFTGPQFSESKYQENKVFCDRIILVRQESGKGKRLERKKAERNQADIKIYPVRSAVNQKNTAEDPLAEKGWAVWEPWMTEGCAVAGIYDSGPKQNMRLDGVKMEQIIGKKGYSLYQVASGLRLKKGMQLHLNRWLITFFVPDSVNPAEKYDIWLSLRFDNERKIVFCDRCLLKPSPQVSTE